MKKIRPYATWPMNRTRWWEILEEHLPHGSGFNYDYEVEDLILNKGARGRWVVVKLSFAHHDEMGGRIDYSDFNVWVKTDMSDIEVQDPLHYTEYQIDGDLRTKVDKVNRLRALWAEDEVDAVNKWLNQFNKTHDVVLIEGWNNNFYDSVVEVMGSDVWKAALMVEAWESDKDYIEETLWESVKEARSEWLSN